jgi:nucleolar complex protein 3
MTILLLPIQSLFVRHVVICDAIKFVFQNDHQGDVTLEATRQISKYMKDREYKYTSIQMLQTMYYKPLLVHVDEAVAAKIATQVNKKKRNNEIAAIESEMKEGSTTVDKIVLAQCQSDTLQIVILTYFRILKSISPPSTQSSISMNNSQYNHSIRDLLPTALEGLAKFAHLINIDTVIDLLSVLRDLLNNNSTTNMTTGTDLAGTNQTLLPVDATLNCILTAFQTLQGPGKEMKIDMKEYIIPLNNQIPRLCSYSCSYNVNGDDSDGSNDMSSVQQQRQQQKSMTDLLLQCYQWHSYNDVNIPTYVLWHL